MTWPAERGDSIKLERGFASGTPGSVEYAVAAREVGDSRFIIGGGLRYRTLRALYSYALENLGFRSAPSRLYAIAALRGLRLIDDQLDQILPPVCREPRTNLKFIEHPAF